jgi:hypothetical protein
VGGNPQPDLGLDFNHSGIGLIGNHLLFLAQAVPAIAFNKKPAIHYKKRGIEKCLFFISINN